MRFLFSFKNNKEEGFSLVELLIYIAVFFAAAGFLVSILTTFTRVQVRQTGVSEVNSQVSFVSSYIQEMVKKASLIDMPENQSTSTIILRMPENYLDPTLIYASGTAIYVKQGNNDPISLTNENVKTDGFLATKFNVGGGFIVQVNLVLSYNNPNPANQFSQSLQFSASRISAATFDSSLYPASSTTLDLGSVSYPWGSGFFSGNLNVGGTIYSGSGISGNTAIKANGNIGFSSAAYGLILKNSLNNCYLVGVNASGTLTTSLTTCP